MESGRWRGPKMKMESKQQSKRVLDVWFEPVRLDYWNLTWQEAEAFIKRFRAKAPERVAALEKNVGSTPGFEDWRADFSAESRRRLGPWLLAVARTSRVDPKDVRVEVRDGLDADIIAAMETIAKEIVTIELSEQTAAMAVDIGIYIGEAVRAQYPSIQWRRCTARCSTNQNYPLLESRTNRGWNPIVQLCNFAIALLEKRFEPECFERMYCDWLRGTAGTEEYRQRKIAKKLKDREARKKKAP